MVRKYRPRRKTGKAVKAVTPSTVRSIIKKELTTGKMVELKRNRTFINGALTASTAANPFGAANGAINNCLYSITTGLSDLANRVGDRIHMVKLHLRGSVDWTGTGVDLLRCIIFVWYDDIAVNPPTPSQILDDMASVNTCMYCEINRDASYPKGKRMRILYDKSFTLDSANPSVSFNKSFKLNENAQGVAGGSFSSAGVGVPYIVYIVDSPNTVRNYIYLDYSDL